MVNWYSGLLVLFGTTSLFVLGCGTAAADDDFTSSIAVRDALVLLQGEGPGVGFVVRSDASESIVVTANHVVGANSIAPPAIHVLRAGGVNYPLPPPA